MHCENINISRHALNKELERNIELKDAFEVVKNGIIITEYLDTKPHPCYLILGFALHVVVAKDAFEEECWLVTVYIPDPVIWTEDFKTKKNKIWQLVLCAIKGHFTSEK
jgi:Domain of unknown function (DUF4258)